MLVRVKVVDNFQSSADRQETRDANPRDPRQNEIRVKGPWNLGLKVEDISAELTFLERCGATGIEQGVVASSAGEERFGMAYLGPQRLMLFEHLIYDQSLPAPLPPGLKHAVFEVDDVEATLETYARNGIMPFFGPQLVTTPYDRRRIAFFRSPSGFIFEVFEILS